MDYVNRLKGGVSQVLVKCLLEDAGYRIVPLGVENIVREVAVLNPTQYKALQLPNELRTLPDFFVADTELTQGWLVEVKYRKHWDDATRERLGASLQEQVKIWQPLHVIIFLGNSTNESYSVPSYFIRVVRVVWDAALGLAAVGEDGSKCKWEYVKWDKFFRVQDVFTNCRAKPKWEDQTIEKTKELAIKLKDLDVFE